MYLGVLGQHLQYCKFLRSQPHVLAILACFLTGTVWAMVFFYIPAIYPAAPTLHAHPISCVYTTNLPEAKKEETKAETRKQGCVNFQ